MYIYSVYFRVQWLTMNLQLFPINGHSHVPCISFYIHMCILLYGWKISQFDQILNRMKGIEEQLKLLFTSGIAAALSTSQNSTSVSLPFNELVRSLTAATSQPVIIQAPVTPAITPAVTLTIMSAVTPTITPSVTPAATPTITTNQTPAAVNALAADNVVSICKYICRENIVEL